MNTIQPDDVCIHFSLPPETFDFDVIGIDSEFFGQQKERLHRPHGKFGCLGMTPNGRDVYMIFETDEIQMFYDRIAEGTHCYHNAKYDLTQLRPYANIPDRKGIFDTQLVEQIRYSGYYTDFALNDLARRYLKIYMDKDVRESFEDADQDKMTDEQIFYAAVDIVCTWMVAKEQMSQIDEDDLGIWEHIERPFLWVMLDTGGITLDVEKWTTRYEADVVTAKQLNDNLPFNPRSPKQVKDFFFDKYKLKLDSSGEDVLIGIAKEYPNIPELQMILDARGLSKAAGTYGESWTNALEDDGKFYPSWKQIGAVTGRMSAGKDKDES